MSKVSYESIIAGLLLKVKSIDNIDFSLTVEDFKKKTKVGVWGTWYYFDNIDSYVCCDKNGTISLRNIITLDYFIEEENQKFCDKLKQVAGNTVLDYFDNFDVEKYKLKKERLLIDNKNLVLNRANVLLISDIQDDYDELIKYGFKNVDYFKSIIRADSYFAKHPEELEKYHLILLGNRNVQRCCFEGQVELENTIERLREEKHILEPSLCRHDYPDRMELVTYLGDRDNHRSWDTKESTYKDIFDRIVENMLINHTLERVDLKDKKFGLIQDEINPNRLPLPMKKSDLKILYLAPIVSEYASEFAKMLGLNITFKEDNNYGLGRYVKSNLGDYDIIIVSRIYSGNILSMNHESTEQCKDTGRELTLLVSYDDVYLIDDSDLGDGIRLNYKFGGNLAPDSEYHSIDFRVLKQAIELEEKGEDCKKYSLSIYSQMKGVIESSVNFYNEALIQMGKNPISDLDFKTADEFDKECLSVIEFERKRKEEELTFIRLFDDIRYFILKYLDYRKKGLIVQNLNGLKIFEEEEFVRVEVLHQERSLGSIRFSKNYEKGYLRIFEIQTLSKKGTLSSPQIVGFYLGKDDNLEGKPKSLDEKQVNTLKAIGKKVNVTLKPLIEQAYKKQSEREGIKPGTLNIKRRNRRRKNS